MANPSTNTDVRASPIRILLVEDNVATRESLSKLLDAQGFQVSTVADGAAAIAALDQAPSPDYILTDLQLPDLDGRAVARHARTLLPRPRVILITGWSLDDPPEVLVRDGVDWVLLKPIHFATLIGLLKASIEVK